ncbi:hypothetical protein EDC39_101458 [Geothermobacter ehrlichii]|uniref:Type II/III secretion system protein n=1 Tax=Geothermobacter ehrlichii TaxID=213224 RepID=A0A5D3WP31_9BACT|nr:hypothetical protein [Geothermobacter ehrlichii]TYP00295.1 hypothetical protein EDC39_101458 [Geothermobacter ehrlichii]
MNRTLLRLLSVAVLALLLSASPVSSAEEVRVFALQHRAAAELLPALRELAGDKVKLAATNGRIVARGEAAELDLVDRALRGLDVVPVQWRIRVRQSRRSIGETFDATGRIGYRLGTTDNAREQSLQVADGESGLIRIGRDEPFIRQLLALAGEVEGFGTTIDYRRLTTGFLVTPRQSGDQVALELVPRMEDARGEGRHKTVVFQELATRVVVPVGRWVNIGRSVVTGSRVSGVPLSFRAGTAEATREFWVLVEKLP